jgi:hypothetical protein
MEAVGHGVILSKEVDSKIAKKTCPVESDSSCDNDTVTKPSVSTNDQETLKKYDDEDHKASKENKVEAFFSHASDALVDSARLFIRDRRCMQFDLNFIRCCTNFSLTNGAGATGAA